MVEVHLCFAILLLAIYTNLEEWVQHQLNTLSACQNYLASPSTEVGHVNQCNFRRIESSEIRLHCVMSTTTEYVVQHYLRLTQEETMVYLETKYSKTISQYSG